MSKTYYNQDNIIHVLVLHPKISDVLSTFHKQNTDRQFILQRKIDWKNIQLYQKNIWVVIYTCVKGFAKWQ